MGEIGFEYILGQVVVMKSDIEDTSTCSTYKNRGKSEKIV